MRHVEPQTDLPGRKPAGRGQAAIQALASFVPEGRLENQELAARFQDWTAQGIYEKTGIRRRRIASPDQFASDLAVEAARSLFATGCCSGRDVDVLILCTQSPDYLLPTTACLVQERLNLPTSVMAFDVNLGCSGYVYGLAMAKSLLEGGLGTRALLITADTYTKYIDPLDRGVATLFGDGAAATLIEVAAEGNPAPPAIGPFVFGTDGAGKENLIVRAGGCRGLQGARCTTLHSGNTHTRPADGLFMDGPEIFAFTLRIVPQMVVSALREAGLHKDDIDLFVLHQANRFMLEALRKKLDLSADRFVIDLEETGNTVSSTIPIALERCVARNRLQAGMRVLLAGFGVGYSWGAVTLTWSHTTIGESS